MAVDTSVIGKHTGAWRVVLDQSVLANFARLRAFSADVRLRSGNGETSATASP